MKAEKKSKIYTESKNNRFIYTVSIENLEGIRNVGFFISIHEIKRR